MALRDNERGVSQIIGFLFAFVIVISLVISYQVVFVPNENEQVEFNYYQAVQNDLQELRDAQLNAEAAGETRSATVRLGTTYPSRAIAQNAAPPSGTVQTVGMGEGVYWSNKTIFGAACGSANNHSVRTNQIEYRPGYSYFSEDLAHLIENTVYYQNASGSVPNLNRTRQIMIQPDSDGSGGTIELYPLNDSFNSNGISAETTEFVGGESGVTTESNFLLCVPTRASRDTWDDWTSGPTVSSNGTAETVDFEFFDEWTIRCHPVGVGEPPVQNTTLLSTSLSTENQTGTDEINPGNDPEGDLVLLGATQNVDSAAADVKFDPWYGQKCDEYASPILFSSDSNQERAAEKVETINNSDFGGGGDLQIGDPITPIDTPIFFDASEGNTTITIDFAPNPPPGNQAVITAGDFFIMVFEFENGERATYFVAVEP